MTDTDVLIRFAGAVECRLGPHGPLGLTLVGSDGDASVQIAFACVPPRDWPQRLEAPVTVLREGPGRFRIAPAGHALSLDASAVFVHRDATRAFEQAVPPRRAPLAKRLFWRAVLAFAGTSIGRRALLAVRR